MRVIVANDHGAVDLKREIVAHLETKGHTVTNLGADSTDSVDYPDMAQRACKEFLKGGYDFGILVCGSGIGISIAANRIRGIRCALVHDLYTAEMCKRHNNANFMAFGGRVTYTVPVVDMLDTYLAASFEGGRHERRVHMLDQLC